MRTVTFALIIGIAYLAAGVLGLIPALLVPPPADAPPTSFAVLYGYLLGLFPVNVLHTAVHFAIGVWGLAAWRGATDPKLYARALAILYGVLAVMGLIPGLNNVFGLIPLHSHDVWLHAGTAALAAYFGWRKEVHMEERRATGERRQRMIPVARERRLGVTDRRELEYGGA
jgi:Domain of unknown function (DUF4383)